MIYNLNRDRLDKIQKFIFLRLVHNFKPIQSLLSLQQMIYEDLKA